MQHKVQIVNHQVEDDIDVKRSSGKHAQPMDLEEHRPVHQAAHGVYRRIEPFEVADLHETAMFPAETDNLVGFGEG